MTKQKLRTIPFEAFLVNSGAELELPFSEFGQGYAMSKKYLYRYSVDEVQIGIRTGFDKWGNSQDFVCQPIPRTEEDFDALHLAIEKVMSEKRERPELEPFDIWPLLRKMRRTLRNTARIEAAKVPMIA